MTCDWVAEQVHAYLDDELEPETLGRVNQHLRGCGACSALYERQRAMSSAVRQHAHYYTAPKHLARSLRSNLRTLAEAERPARLVGGWGWFASGAATACAIALAINLTLFEPMTPSAIQERTVEQELISSHVRSLMVDHLTDVASSDQHTVKPWFNGKVDLAPPVIDLASDDYPLIGGRLDYVGRRPVVVLVYRHRQHPINLFIWPASKGEPPQAMTRLGYNLVHWTDGALTYWAVSDLNLGDLQSFRTLIVANAPRTD